MTPSVAATGVTHPSDATVAADIDDMNNSYALSAALFLHIVRSGIWRSFVLQGKVAALVRRGGQSFY